MGEILFFGEILYLHVHCVDLPLHAYRSDIGGTLTITQVRLQRS